MKFAMFTLILSVNLSSLVFAADKPTLLSGVGFTVSTDSRKVKPSSTEVNSCSVSVNGTEIAVVAEIDPGFSGEPTTMDIKDAVKKEFDGGYNMTYSTALKPESQSVYCEMGAISGGKQELSIQSYKARPVYSLRTETNCTKDGSAFIKTHTARCDMNFQRRP